MVGLLTKKKLLLFTSLLSLLLASPVLAGPRLHPEPKKPNPDLLERPNLPDDEEKEAEDEDAEAPKPPDDTPRDLPQ